MMGDIPGITNTFVANTKAKSAQVNTNFNDLVSDIGSGTSHLFANGYKNNTLSNGNATIGANQCFNAGFFTVDSNASYLLSSSSSRMSIGGELTIHGTVDLTSGATLLIY
jgi:hypothetical protein